MLLSYMFLFCFSTSMGWATWLWQSWQLQSQSHHPKFTPKFKTPALADTLKYLIGRCLLNITIASFDSQRNRNLCLLNERISST